MSSDTKLNNDNGYDYDGDRLIYKKDGLTYKWITNVPRDTAWELDGSVKTPDYTYRKSILGVATQGSVNQDFYGVYTLA